jgi:hypothetical protein
MGATLRPVARNRSGRELIAIYNRYIKEEVVERLLGLQVRPLCVVIRP